MGFKIAIGGKGGVGKTTVSAIWSELFSKDGFDVLAIDADSDANLAAAFGLCSDENPRPLIELKELIHHRTGTDRDTAGAYFKLNPHVSDLPDKYSVKINGLKLLVLGSLKNAGGGCACPEGAFLKALLTYTILQRKEAIIVDLDAGVECMGRATIPGIDALVVVVEPGSRSTDTARNVVKQARDLGIKHTAIIVNKITDPSQIALIKENLVDCTILGSLYYDSGLQQADLQRTRVFDASQEVVSQLCDAKESLLKMINLNK